jgi:FMN phosphatase YigB (HAD superfamily)
MMPAQRIQAIFFDIGDTLGHRDAAGQFHVFAGTLQLLAAMKSTLGLRLGVITNLPQGMTTAEIRQILSDAGILSFLDPQGVVTSADAPAAKPDKAIYQFAAGRIHLPEAACLYVGESPAEVQGAIDAGMAAILKPFPPPGEHV